MSDPAYLDNYRLYATLSGSAVDITPYTIKSDIESEWGINGIEATDLLADSGVVKFTLNNRSELFTPGASTALSGWRKGVVIKLICVYDGEVYNRGKGRIDTLNFNDSDYTVDVTCLDWMNYAARFPLQTPSIQVDQTGDEVLTTILSGMGITPENTYFDVGCSNFSILFDSADKNTKAYSEFSKICRSEVSPIYLKKDRVYGETLVFENRRHRSGLDTLDVLPLPKNEQPRLLTSDGGHVLNTTGGDVITHGYRNAFFDNNMNDITMVYGQGVVNSARVTANPKTYDSASVVLHQLAEPMFIGAGKTIEFYGNYVDAYGNPCNVITGSMIAPAATTDYLCYTNKNGSGTNLTTSISASAVYGSAQVKFSVRNTAGKSGWLTRMNARGIGIHAYNQIDAIEENQLSYDEYDYQSLSLEQSYQTDLVVGTELIRKIVEAEKQPRMKVVDVSFLANDNSFLMMAFLNADIGSLIHIRDDRYGVDGYFYIQKIKFRISMGGIVRYTFVLRSLLSLALGLTLVNCSFSASSTDAICYGNVESLIDLPQMTISAEIYPTSFTGTGHNKIATGWVNEQGGFELILGGTGNPRLTQLHTTSGGVWLANDPVALNAWSTISVSIDSTTLNPPVFYVNGVEVGSWTWIPPVGSTGSNNGMDFCIGNIHGQDVSTNFTYPFIGTIRRVDVNSKLFTDTEALEWANGETITDDLVFQGNCIRTAEISIYDNAVLTDELKLLDNVYGAVGTANGSPLCTIP